MRYFIDVSDGRSITEDRDGQDYATDEAAREAALEAARALMAGSARQGQCRRHWRFHVLDASRTPLFEVPFDTALSPASLARPARADPTVALGGS